eukprot:scaffold19655_cov104-Isochrysis_galbana.AAC.4
MSERAKPSVYVSPRSTKVISSCSAVGSAASAFWNCEGRRCEQVEGVKRTGAVQSGAPPAPFGTAKGYRGV